MHGAASPREISALGQSWTPHVQIQVRAGGPRGLSPRRSPYLGLWGRPLCVSVSRPPLLLSQTRSGLTPRASFKAQPQMQCLLEVSGSDSRVWSLRAWRSRWHSHGSRRRAWPTRGCSDC